VLTTGPELVHEVWAVIACEDPGQLIEQVFPVMRCEVREERVDQFTAADLVEALYRGLADNSVGRVIEAILKADLALIDEIGFAPLDDTEAQLLFRFVAAAYERRSLGIASHWPFDQWGRFLPEHTTAISLLDRLLHHAVVVVTEGSRSACARPAPREGAPATLGAS